MATYAQIMVSCRTECPRVEGHAENSTPGVKDGIATIRLGDASYTLLACTPEQLEAMATDLLTIARELRATINGTDVDESVVDALPSDWTLMQSVDGKRGRIHTIDGVCSVECVVGGNAVVYPYDGSKWKPIE